MSLRATRLAINAARAAAMIGSATYQAATGARAAYQRAYPSRPRALRRGGGLRGTRVKASRYTRGILKNGRKKTIKKLLRAINRKIKADLAYHTHRVRRTLDMNSGGATVSYTVAENNNITTMQAAMANLRYYNPAVPGTLTTADASTGTYTRVVHFSSIYRKILVRNNYLIPCTVTIYSFVPKQDTNIDPVAFYTDAVTDLTIGGAITQPLSYITDLDMVNDNWRVVKTVSRFLLPGKLMSCYHSVKNIDFDPSNADTHNLAFQKKYGAQSWVVRLEGALGHMPAADVLGTCGTEVDVLTDTVYKITYDAGTNLNDYSYNNLSGAVDLTALVSNKPVSDNLALEAT